MMTYRIEQPQPFDPTFPRYYPQRPFPPYRHIPGVTPHPFYDPRGHSYGLHEEFNNHVPPPEAWRENHIYLYGIDLYNFSYWWEANEIWEGLWSRTEGNYRLYLQGLIQISVSLLKWHTRKLQGLRLLSTTGRDKLRQVLKNLDDPKGMYMGIDLNEFLARLDTFFAPFFSDTVSEQTFCHSEVNLMIYLNF